MGDHSSRTTLARRLQQPTRATGGNTPMRRPYSVLLPVGFALPRLSPAARCALTAPFHPCPGLRRGGLLSVALSLGSPPAGVTRHRRSAEPGLSSACKHDAAARPSGPAPIEAPDANSNRFPLPSEEGGRRRRRRKGEGKSEPRANRSLPSPLGALRLAPLPTREGQSSPRGFGSSSARSRPRHSPSISPSISSGRKRR